MLQRPRHGVPRWSAIAAGAAGQGRDAGARPLLGRR